MPPAATLTITPGRKIGSRLPERGTTRSPSNSINSTCCALSSWDFSGSIRAMASLRQPRSGQPVLMAFFTSHMRFQTQRMWPAERVMPSCITAIGVSSR